MNFHANDVTYYHKRIKQFDRDLYYMLLLLPQEEQKRALCLLSLHVELMHIYSHTKEIMLGLIRFQWWQESIEKIYKNAEEKEHPALRLLHAFIPYSNMSFADFVNIIDAHRKGYEAKEFTSYDDLQDNIQQTLGQVFLNIFPDQRLKKNVITNIETLVECWFVSHTILSLSAHIGFSLPFFPEDDLKANDITIEALYSPVHNTQREQLLQHYANHLQQSLIIISKNSKLFKRFKILKILKYSTHENLKQLKKYHYNPFDSKLIALRKKPWRLWQFLYWKVIKR